MTTPEGKYYRSRRAMSDVSQSLDIITAAPGQTLIRGEHGWIGTDGAGGNPRVWSYSSVDGYSTSGYALKGTTFIPPNDLWAFAMSAAINTAVGGTYVGSLWLMDGSTLVGKLVETEPYVSEDDKQVLLQWNFADPVPLGADTRYAVCINRTDATTATPAGLYGGSSYRFPLPWIGDIGYVRKQVIDPEPGEVMDMDTNSSPYPCYLQVQII
jgi:hypothetical protein